MGKPERLIGPEFEYDGFANGWNSCVLAWEHWEEERPARWVPVPSTTGGNICSGCYYLRVNFFEAPPDTCPQCGKRMVQDG